MHIKPTWGGTSLNERAVPALYVRIAASVHSSWSCVLDCSIDDCARLRSALAVLARTRSVSCRPGEQRTAERTGGAAAVCSVLLDHTSMLPHACKALYRAQRAPYASLFLIHPVGQCSRWQSCCHMAERSLTIYNHNHNQGTYM